MGLSYLHRALWTALILAASAGGAAAPASAAGSADYDQSFEGSLDEVKDKQRVFLVATRSRVVDVRGPDPSALLDALGEGRVRIHPYPYTVIARKLNEFIRKGRGMTAVGSAAEADYVIYFNVLEYRRTLNGVYPYGELFVILNRDSGGKPQPPRIVWRTKKATWAEDAAKEFLRELKRARGER